MYTLDIFRDVRPSPSSMVVPTDLQRTGDFSQTYVSGSSGPNGGDLRSADHSADRQHLHAHAVRRTTGSRRT